MTQWVMTLWLKEDGTVMSTDGRLLSLTDEDPFDEGIHQKVVEWAEKGEEALSKPFGCTAAPLDTQAGQVRSREMPIGNFFTDAMRAQHRTDVAMFQGGGIRGDRTFPPGPLSMATITVMNPFGNTVVKIYMTGAELKHYISQSLNCYEETCGLFVHISGLKYVFNPNAPKGGRLVRLTHLDGTPVDDNASFTVALSDFMLETSPYKNNKLYDMVTKNDAVQLQSALFDATQAAGAACINPVVDGRVTQSLG